jgi:hypothetical protein
MLFVPERRRSSRLPGAIRAERVQRVERVERVEQSNMNIEIRPATIGRFDDVAILLGPKNPDASVCWCLSHRLDSKANRELVGGSG